MRSSLLRSIDCGTLSKISYISLTFAVAAEILATKMVSESAESPEVWSDLSSNITRPYTKGELLLAKYRCISSRVVVAPHVNIVLINNPSTRETAFMNRIKAETPDSRCSSSSTSAQNPNVESNHLSTMTRHVVYVRHVHVPCITCATQRML